jgi:hypothetical protein
MFDDLCIVKLDKAGASYGMNSFPGGIGNEMEMKPGHAELARAATIASRPV